MVSGRLYCGVWAQRPRRLDMSPRCLDVSTIASGHVYHDCSLAVAAVLPGVWSCPPWCLVSGRARCTGTCLLERRITATTTNVQGHYITIVYVCRGEYYNTYVYNLSSLA